MSGVRAHTVRDRDEKRALLARLDRQVKEQKLTPLEIQSLSSDRQNLTRAMHDVQSRYRAVLSKTMSLEIDLNKKIDEATALCGEYDDKAQQLGLLDGPVKGFEDVPFAQEVNGASEQPVPEGLAGVVKPALQALRTNTRNEVRDLSLQGVKVEEELTRIKEVLGDLGDREAQHEQELDVVDREKDQMQQVRLSLTHLGRGAVSPLLSSRTTSADRLVAARVTGDRSRDGHVQRRARPAAEPGQRHQRDDGARPRRRQPPLRAACRRVRPSARLSSPPLTPPQTSATDAHACTST